MDLTIPALNPGQITADIEGTWTEPPSLTGTVTWTFTIDPTDAEAYTTDKSREYIVVLQLTSTGDPPGTP
jgi:hypothetical protein